jgi:hypothetical protein
VERPLDAFDAALAVAAALESAGTPYAIGGAIAYALWGPPRGTMDVDLNLFVEPEGVPAAIAPLLERGITFRPGDPVVVSRTQGMLVGRVGEFRLDVFTPSIPFSWEALRTRFRTRVRDIDAWFLSAEATCVFKLLFFRGKDVADLERLVAQQGRRLDAAYVRRWTAEMMGEDDERVTTWDAIVDRHWR